MERLRRGDSSLFQAPPARSHSGTAWLLLTDRAEVIIKLRMSSYVAFLFACIYMYTHICVNTYIYTYIHTYIYIAPVLVRAFLFTPFSADITADSQRS